MANGYESQRIGSRSGGGMTELMQLLKMFQGDPRADERKIAKKSSNLESLIKITNDISSMDSLGSRIKEADLSFDDMGDDETGDILKTLYNQKYDIMQKGQIAFNKINEMNTNLGVKDEESFKDVSRNIMDMNWAETNNKMRELYSLENDLKKAQNLNMTFKGSDEISPELLSATLSQYQGFYNKKFDLLARRNIFDIPDEDVQAFDEEFGVALMTYGPEQFSRFMGGHQKLLQSKLSDTEQKANSFYKHYVSAINAGGFAEASDELGIFGDVQPGAVLSASLYEEKYKEYQQQAQMINERHKEFYGSHFSDNPSLIKGATPTSDSILDGAVNKFLSSKDKDEDREVKKDLSPTTIEGEKIESKPIIHKYKETPIQIIWDKDKGKAITTKPTPIEETLAKRLKKEDINKSIQSANFIKKDTGKNINIVEYNKNENIYIDENGSKFNEEDIIVSSIDELRPKLKKANGDFYYWNPVGKKKLKWGQDKIFKNQKIEKLIIKGKVRSIPVTSINKTKFHWIDGEWKHLPKR